MIIYFRLLFLSAKCIASILATILLNSSNYAQYAITKYNTATSFPNDFTYNLHQDLNGYIWIGSDAGVVRFGGREFTLFNAHNGLRSNYVIDIAPLTSTQNILATWGGGLHVMEEGGRVHYLTIADSLLKLNHVIPINGNFVCDFLADRFFFYKKENNRYQPKQLSLYSDLLKERTEEVENRQKPDLRFKKISNRIFAYDVGRDKSPMYEIHGDSLATPLFRFLNDYTLCDFGLYDTGVFYGLTSEKLILFTEPDGVIGEVQFPQIPHQLLRFYKKDHLEIVLAKLPNDLQLLYIIDRATGEHCVIDENHLAYKKVSDVLIDKEYSIWVSTFGNGILKARRNTCLPVHEISKAAMFIDFIQDDSSFYLLGHDKLCVVRTEPPGLECVSIPESYGMSKRKGQILIFNKESTIQDTFKYNNKLFRFREDYRVVHSGNDSIFFKENSLFTLQKGKITHLISENINEQYKNIDINDIILSGNSIWCGTNQGIYVFNQKTQVLEKRVTTSEGLSHNLVVDLEPDGNDIWVATSKGVNRIRDGRVLPAIKNMEWGTMQVNALHKDVFGQLWLATGQGLSMYNGINLYHFDKQNGLASSTIFKLFPDSLGRLWLLGNNGVARLDLKSPFKPCSAGKLLIKQSQSQFNIELIDYSGKKSKIAYTLNNSPWKEINNQNLDFKNNRYGRYSIRFRTRKPDSDWAYSETYYFSIKRPWYKSLLFISIMVSLVALLAAIVVHNRLEKLRNRNAKLKTIIEKSENLKKELDQTRQNIAKDFHDELGNKIAGIVLLSDIAAQEVAQTNQNQLHQKLLRIQEDAGFLYAGIKDFIWSIDYKSDNLQELIYYLKDFGEDLFAQTDIKFFVYTEIERLTLRLPFYWAKHLLLIYKEAMTNALKHSQASRVEFKCQLTGNELQIELLDNGLGFELETIKRVGGLENMKKRASIIGVTINIETNNGTRVGVNALIP